MTRPSPGFHANDIARHSEWMRRLARGLLADAAAADDVVQDVWTRHGDGRVRAGYLAAVVRTFARRHRRSELRRSRREHAAARHEELPSAAEVAARSEVARRLADAVERLEEPYRTTVVLRYYDGLSSAEIARRAGIPAATVRARLKRGLDVLRARLDEGDGGRASWVSALLPLTRARVAATSTLAASLTTLVVMKIVLVSVLAVSGLALLWMAFAVEDDPQVRPGAGVAAREGILTPAEDEGLRPGAPADAARAEVRLERPGAIARAESDAAPAPGQVRARAQDPGGAALGDAWLRLRQLPDDTALADGSGQLVLRVEPDELERLAGLDGARNVEVELGASGHRTRYLRASLFAGSATLELGDVVLEPGGVLNGRVVDESGVGLPGALVVYGMPHEVEPADPAAARHGPGDLDTKPWSGRDPALRTTSGPGGEFRLEGLAVGHGTAWARTATSLWAFSQPIGIRAGEEVWGMELVVRDAPGEVIAGRVVDPDGRSLPGLELMLSKSGGSDGWWNRRSDARGEFHFVPPDGAAQDISASSPSWEWEDVRVENVPAGTLDLVIAFERSEWLRVAVVDEAGESVRNGHVVGLPGSGPTDRALLRCESPLDEYGHARLRRPAGALRVRVRAPGYRDQIVGPLDPALFPDPLTVTLAPVPALTGRVLRPDGRPAAGASVSLHRGARASAGVIAPGGGGGGELLYLSHQGWSGDRDAFVYAVGVEPVARVTADEEGRFRLPLPGVDADAAGEVATPDEGLAGLRFSGDDTRRTRDAKPDVPWYVHAAVEGEATMTSGPHLFDPTRDEELDLRLPGGGAIAGRLVLENGASTAGWTARASDGLAQVAEAPVGADGSFELRNLHAGGWQVRVFEPGRRYYPGALKTERVPVPDVEVVAGRSVEYEHVTRPRASARLLGRVRIDGAPPGPWRVVVRTATPQYGITTHEATLDPDGGFELSLEPGLATKVGVFDVTDGVRLSIEARPTIVVGINEWSVAFETATLEGTIPSFTPSGNPFGGGAIYESERGDFKVRTMWTPPEDGTFGPLTVPAGPGVLRGPQQDARTPGPIWAELDLRPGEKHRL